MNHAMIGATDWRLTHWILSQTLGLKSEVIEKS